MEVFPIRIRADLVVQIGNLPEDLTKKEADKICRVVMAHVVEETAKAEWSAGE